MSIVFQSRHALTIDQNLSYPIIYFAKLVDLPECGNLMLKCECSLYVPVYWGMLHNCESNNVIRIANVPRPSLDQFRARPGLGFKIDPGISGTHGHTAPHQPTK
ncbi:hypothetical protein XELAEV_18031768mg [Xenopus laevis]|uniref:Uncharacterized protein n=1 Tax=Xenopus laevis TaxID=8355 RepID=A0A974HG00_XENLA|nr:hypothetical protein XELAEV_18031768mg [Xenopus laevis]